MDHATARERMQDDLDGRLEAPQSAELQAHLDACPECAAEARGLASLRSALRAMPQPRAPADLRGDVMAALPSGRLLRFPAWLAGVAVAAVVVVAVAVFHGSEPGRDGSIAATAQAPAAEGRMRVHAEATEAGAGPPAPESFAADDSDASKDKAAEGAAGRPAPSAKRRAQPEEPGEAKAPPGPEKDAGFVTKKLDEEAGRKTPADPTPPAASAPPAADPAAAVADTEGERKNVAGADDAADREKSKQADERRADAPPAPAAAELPVRYVAFETEAAARRFVARLAADAKDFVAFAPAAETSGKERADAGGGSGGGGGPAGGAGSAAGSDSRDGSTWREGGRTQPRPGEVARADAKGVTQLRIEKLRKLASACGGIVAERAVAASAELPPELSLRTASTARLDAAKPKTPAPVKAEARGKTEPAPDETIVVLVLPPAVAAPTPAPSGR